ncbi:hypothetical protein Sya03_09520 [Spirilliplanes yamanashiensis]|uniref:Uncharacterized protein n=2 Tax=Spirilliplanes yamanashiensis TaxID=42233 RepID=A0A8J3Y589_9ACTN|nr:hypothetical protein Sya03_09520 [Spirilliplanes yamanashiensis]
MDGMADPPAATGLWNWCLDGTLDPGRVRAAVAVAVRRPTIELAGPPVPGAVQCDVWHTEGEFPTVVDCYLAPSDVPESVAARAVAARLDSRCLLPDDSLDPSRHLLITPDGGIRPVHVDVADTDAGPRWTNVRPCTGIDVWCQGGRGGSRPAAAA